MRVFIIFILAFFLFETIINAGSKIIIRKNDDGKEIAVKTDDVLQIELEAFGGAGYEWKFEDLNYEYFELIEEETKVVTKSGFVGTPNIKVWHLRVKKAGETEIIMFCFRVWEGKDKAADKFKIKVKIF